MKVDNQQVSTSYLNAQIPVAWQTFKSGGLTCERSEETRKTTSFFPNWLNCIIAPLRKLWRLVAPHPGQEGQTVSHKADRATDGQSADSPNPPRPDIEEIAPHIEAQIRERAVMRQHRKFHICCEGALRKYSRKMNEKLGTDGLSRGNFHILADHVVEKFMKDFDRNFFAIMKKNPPLLISAALYNAYDATHLRSDIYAKDFELVFSNMKSYYKNCIEQQISDRAEIPRPRSFRSNMPNYFSY